MSDTSRPRVDSTPARLVAESAPARVPAESPAPGLAAAVLDGARRHPSELAVLDGARRLTYAELDALSAAVAQVLHAHGVRPGQAVAVCLPRSWHLVCVMLGVLRAGAVVVPLDAQSPPERRRYVLADASSAVVVHADAESAAADGELPYGTQSLTVDELLAGSGAAGWTDTTAAPVSFLFYTSGSTGRPKGVEVRDAGVLRLASPGYLPVVEGARYACLSNPAFDALSFEVWVPLLTGGCCVIVRDETAQTPEVLAAELERLRIDVLFVTVALFNAVVDKVPHCFSGIGQVLVGGEQLNAGLIRRWYAHNSTSATQLHNVYGPTEATTFALCHPIPRDLAADVVPIGRPLPGTHALAVVDGSRAAEPGEVAELHLAGAALAAGYRNLPEETARRFVTLPWYDGGARLHYRTGDLVRRDAEGRFTYVERADRQVKVRGFRIEPGELERCVTAHPAVRQAYVCTDRDAYGVNELLAYVVLGAPLSYEDFARHLAEGLPTYMRPHRVHLVDALPLNSNGKVDRAALLRHDGPPWRADREHPEEAHRELTPVQAELLRLAGAVTGVDDLRLSDRWTAVGGDSLKALRLRFEVRRRWAVELPQALVLRTDLAGLAAAIDAGAGAGGGASPYPVPTAAAGARSAPATAEQERLWLLQQQDPGSLAYQVPLAFRVAGEPDLPALRRALRALVARHPALRTSFTATPTGLRQTVGEPYDPWWAATDPAGMFTEPFDLSRPGLLRARWTPDGESSSPGGELALALHHIAVDGWSLNILFQDLSVLYAEALSGAAPAAESTGAPAPAHTPLDFAVWQREWCASEAYGKLRSELRSLQAEFAAEAVDASLHGPLEPVHPVQDSERPTGRLLHTSLDAGRRAALDRLCGELGLTRFQVLLSVYAWSLYGVTGRTRLRLAGPVAGRPVAEFGDGVGMFANTVLLPVEVAADEPLRAQMLRLAARARAVLDRQEVTLADALADLPVPARTGTERRTPFDFLFVLENTDFGALTLPGCAVRPRWVEPAAAKCPLTLSVLAPGTSSVGEPGDGDSGRSGLDCLWEYDAAHFDATEVAAVAGLFGRGLDLLTRAPRPDGPAPTPGALVAPYRDRLPDPGRADPVPLAFTTVAEGFARQVARTPEAIALVMPDGDRTLTYAELDFQAAQLAATLAAAYPSPVPDDGASRCVALHLAPSVEHVVALLALARLNLTAVPLDPAYPPALLQQILATAAPLCVLVPPDAVGDPLAGVAPPSLPRRPVVLARERGAGCAPGVTARTPHAASRPLYMLFTSGSTGTPKGVRVPDSTLCNLIQWQQESGGLAAAAVTQQFSMLSFDVSFQEVFSTLCGGGRLHLVRPRWRQDAPALLDQLESSGAQRLFLPYVALHVLAEHGVRLGRYPSRLREVVTAGEQLLCTDAIKRWFAGMPGARLFNHYGPTETHVVSALCLEGDPANWPQRPAVGLPVAGAWLRVVDDSGRPLPPGRPGHLLIGGTMVTRCYPQDSGLNEERFVELPGAGTFYRSGDLARFDRDGLLHCLGRDDQQIKRSGFRLELGQIEAALLQHPHVVNAVVVCDDDTGPQDGVRIVACLEAGSEVPSPADLHGHLAPLLPSYVRVDRFRVLARLPLAPSGKLDRRAALHAPGEELGPPVAARPAASVALSVREARLTELFEEVLGLPIGRDERFFDAGATSLGLMRFHLRCTAEPELRFSIPDLFEHVSIGRLAAFLDGTSTEDTAACEDTRPYAAAEASASDAAEPVAVVGMAVRVPGADDLAAFWELIRGGARGIEHFDAPEGVVGARSQMSGLLSFDPEHFGISRQEARLMDPQQRHLLMSCVQALAHAGISGTYRGGARRTNGPRVGLVAGCGENTYFQAMLRDADPERLPDGFQLALHHDKDFLTTKVAYHLDLSGPAFTVQAACASSLVAVHVAGGLLRQGDADVMLAGGVLVDTLLTDGYPRRTQHIFSEDGHCRGFSDDATGTIGASGVGVVVLKRLRDARRDGDTVYAVLRGSAVNNDGAQKLSYSAPSLPGQREVIGAALRRSGRTAADLGYVEAHGTGTPLGDPVEVGALRQAFGLAGKDRCALASVKSQIGHLGAAAGVVGLVRAVLAIHHAVIPPQVDFRRLNPQIGPDAAPFRIPVEAAPWPTGRPRVAAVSSFGIGGTNAHVVLEADAPPTGGADDPQRAVPACLLLSSRSPEALREDAARIADHLDGRPESYEQVLRHLQAGRPARRWRVAAVCDDASTAVAWLRTVADGGTRPTAVPEQGRGPGERLPTDPVTTDPAPSDPVRVELLAADLLHADELTPASLARAWADGREVRWAAGPAQAPWDFPPPAFALAEYDFERARPGADPMEPAGTWPQRLPEDRWLHQPHWVRLSRAGHEPAPGGADRRPLLVVMAAVPPTPDALRPFEALYDRVVLAVAAEGFAPAGVDRFEVDPADPDSLRRLFEAVVPPVPDHPVVDWLHALPLADAEPGPLGTAALARARWACLDTPAALLRAAAGPLRRVHLRPWWLSYGAQPVEGPVERPESGLLAGAAEVPAQEGLGDGRWLDLPDGGLGRWVPALLGLLTAAAAGPDRVAGKVDAPSDAVPLPRRLALRQGYWWHQALLPVAVREPATRSPLLPPPGTQDRATYVVLGGTGGVGGSLAAHLLAEAHCQVVLVSRHAELPSVLVPLADRVEWVEADLATAAPEEVLALLEERAPRIDGIVHAAGAPGGGLLTGRDRAVMARTTEAKLRGALVVEQVIARYRPAFAAYCSSMSVLFGGVGQFDYAAANGLLDGFARYRSGAAESTLRIALDWDIWSEGGMAVHAPHTDARHRAHLAVGMTAAEGSRVFGRALGLQLPHVMVSTTDIDRAGVFYAGSERQAGPERPDAPGPSLTPADPAVAPAAPAGPDPAALLSGWLCQWLGLDDGELDPDVSLYDHGADSLTMIDLVTKIESHFGTRIELSRLSHRVSLDEVLGHLRPPDPVPAPTSPLAPAPALQEHVTLEVWQHGTGRDLVCLVHPVGGDIQAYRALVSALGPDLTVCLIADPALNTDDARGPALSLAQRAHTYRTALQRSFPHGTWRWQVAGWSFGAWVAHAMAAEAEAAGRPVEGLHLLDPPPPDASPRFLTYDEQGIEAVFAQELRLGARAREAVGGEATVSRAAQTYAERLARCCRANLVAMSQHTLPRLVRTPSYLWLAADPVPGLPDLGSPSSQLALWKAGLSPIEESRVLDTTHYGIVRPPHTDAVAAVVRTAVKRAAGTEGEVVEGRR
ncbi:amino acid adenylation domain-containing protein [Streptomyces sp. NPDC087440]|uniref:amino acid adenylation domain-containing protein n=1 Tax=Streptomyces sp. NPDC087440 TaxID=3365790 RepID=UPI00380928B2